MMMIESLAAYKALLTKKMKKADFETLLNFGVQVSGRLFVKYRQDLVRYGFKKEAELMDECMSFFKDVLEQGRSVSDGVLESKLTRLYQAGYDTMCNLDLSEVYQLGMNQMINSFEFCIAYLMEKKPKHIVGCAFCPIKVIELILVKEGLDMSKPDQHLDHALFREEFDFQLSILENLVSSRDV